MTDRLHRRMTRHAAYAAAHVAFLVALVLVAGDEAWAGIVALLSFLPYMFAWGPYNADVAMNPSLDETARTRWRIALYLAPITLPLYWHLHVRDRH